MGGGATEHTRTFEAVGRQRKLGFVDVGRKKVSAHMTDCEVLIVIVNGCQLFLVTGRSFLHGQTSIDWLIQL